MVLAAVPLTTGPGDPARLVRRSVNVAARKLGDRAAAYEAVLAASRAALEACQLAAARYDAGRFPVGTWLEEVAREAARVAREAGVDV